MSASPANPVICLVTVDIAENRTEDVPIHLHDDPETVAKAFASRHSLPAQIEAPLIEHFRDNYAQAKIRHDEALAAKRKAKSESVKSKHTRTATESSAFELLETCPNDPLTAIGSAGSPRPAGTSKHVADAASPSDQPAYSPIAAACSGSASQPGFALSSESSSVVSGTAPLPVPVHVPAPTGGVQGSTVCGVAPVQKSEADAEGSSGHTSSSRRMTGDSEELEAMYAQLLASDVPLPGAARAAAAGPRARAHTADSIDIVPGRRSSGASSAGLCYTKEALITAASQAGVASKRQSSGGGPVVVQAARRASSKSRQIPAEDGTPAPAGQSKPPVARLPRVASLPPRAAAVPPPLPDVSVSNPSAVARPETFQRLHQEAQARQARVRALADKVSSSELQALEAAKRRMSGNDLPFVPAHLQALSACDGAAALDPVQASERLYAQAADLATKRSKAAVALASERAAVSEWVCPSCCRANSGRFDLCQHPSKGGKLPVAMRTGQAGRLCGTRRPAEENKPVISSFASRIQRELKANDPEYVDWSVSKFREDKERREAEAKKAADEQLKAQAPFKPVINAQSVQIAAPFRDRRALDVLPSGGPSDVHSVLYAEGRKRMHQSHALQVSGTAASKVKDVSSDLFDRLYAEGEELQAKLQAARSRAEHEARVAAAGKAGRVVALPTREASKLYDLAAEKAAERQSKLQAQLEEVEDAARAKHTSSKSELLLQQMRQKALIGVYRCLLLSTRHGTGGGKAAMQGEDAWTPGLLSRGQLDRLVCAIDVCSSRAYPEAEAMQQPVPVSNACLETLGDSLLAAFVDKTLQIMCCDKRDEQMTVSFEGFCGVLGRLVEDAGGGPHVYLQARKARKAAQVQRQVEEAQRKEQESLTFAPVIDARSAQLVEQARARQIRSRSSSAAPSLDEPTGPIDAATVQPVSRRSSAAHSYAPADAPVHVRQHAQVYAVADKRRAAEVDALRAQLAQHPFAPVLGQAKGAVHSEAHPEHRTLQASKLQAAQLAARAKAVMRTSTMHLQTAAVQAQASQEAPAEHLNGALTIIGGMRRAAAEVSSSGMNGMASGLSMGTGITGAGSTAGQSLGMGPGHEGEHAQPNFSPAPSLMSEGALDALLHHDQHSRFSPLLPGTQDECEYEAGDASPASTVATGARAKEGLARLASSSSMLPRWADGPDTDDTDSQGVTKGSNDAIYGPLNTEDDDVVVPAEVGSGSNIGAPPHGGSQYPTRSRPFAAFALPALPPSVGSAQTTSQGGSSRSAAPCLFSPSRVYSKLEDYGYTPIKQEAEEEQQAQEEEDHTTAPANCENNAPEMVPASPARKTVATTLFLSPASHALGSTLASTTTTCTRQAGQANTVALAGTKLLCDQPQEDHFSSTALIVSHAGGPGSLESLMQQLGIDALEERIAKLMQTVNTPIV